MHGHGNPSDGWDRLNDDHHDGRRRAGARAASEVFRFRL
jgi:hypothetical protein